jgi:hypothetical protein
MATYKTDIKILKDMKKVIAAVTTLALLGFATPAFASVNSSYIKIETSNSGSISNTTEAKADTGDNYAGGSYGGNGGSGGDVEAGKGDGNNGGATAGDGGNGGNASAGGLVDTGDASADAGSINKLNTTDVKMDLDGEDINSSKVKIETDNDEGCGCNTISNTTRAKADSGDNTAKGSRGGKGGRGGDVEAYGGWWSSTDGNNGGAEAGKGGTGGAGGIGGEVRTGAATSNAGAVNVLNTTMVRVRL